jgi:geranylgeranyl diphosphate synthase type II
MTLDFKEKLNIETQKTDRIVQSYLPQAQGYQKTVIEAMRYSVQAGGKRLRPMLLMQTCRLFDPKLSHPSLHAFMAAIEMIHTYSLVHDDLPAMDNDEYRRGKKTTHIVYGEDMAILAGDALLNDAFELMSKDVADCAKKGDPTQTLQAAQAMAEIASKAGIYGMIGGQTVDVESEGQKISEDKLIFIHRLKTCALLEASMAAGAMLGGAAQEQIVQIRKIAANVGLAFQIQDDILDVVGDTQTLGKPVGSDEKNEKCTYVTLYGIEGAKSEVSRLTEEALSLLNGFEGDTAFLADLTGYLAGRQM